MSDELYPFVVVFKDEGAPDEHAFVMFFAAEDERQAREQAEDAEPNSRILRVARYVDPLGGQAQAPLLAAVIFEQAEREVDFSLKLTDLSTVEGRAWNAYVFALRELSRLYLEAVRAEVHA